MPSIVRIGVVGVISVLVASCTSRHQAQTLESRERRAPAALTEGPAPQPKVPLEPLSGARSLAPYPRAKWRLAKADLEHVVLWFSHILVRYAGTRDLVSFNLGYWASVPPPSTRSRTEALQLAERIAREATLDPTRFSELARQYSEELPSRDEGGEIGGYGAPLFTLWPQVLDALAALRPGQTSQVVETKYGFHILYRAVPPREEKLSGEHILVGHVKAPWLQVFARDKGPDRSREEAVALAQYVYEQARAEPGRWSELVDRYSEHRDAIAGGDFGTWSTREPSSFPARMKRLRELSVGDVGAPIETHLGFEIIRRTPLRTREQYRALVLEFRLDDVTPGAPHDDQTARNVALARATEAAARLIGAPAPFEAPSAVQVVRQWEDGRELPMLSRLLRGLEIGGVTAEPAMSEYGFQVARRLAPEAIQSPRFDTELPDPSQPDLEQFLRGMPASNVADWLRACAVRAQHELALKDATAEQLRAIHDVGGRINAATSPEERNVLIERVFEQSKTLLGDVRYQRYRSTLNDVAMEQLLDDPEETAMDGGF